METECVPFHQICYVNYLLIYTSTEYTFIMFLYKCCSIKPNDYLILSIYLNQSLLTHCNLSHFKGYFTYYFNPSKSLPQNV